MILNKERKLFSSWHKPEKGRPCVWKTVINVINARRRLRKTQEKDGWERDAAYEAAWYVDPDCMNF